MKTHNNTAPWMVMKLYGSIIPMYETWLFSSEAAVSGWADAYHDVTSALQTFDEICDHAESLGSMSVQEYKRVRNNHYVQIRNEMFSTWGHDVDEIIEEYENARDRLQFEIDKLAELKVKAQDLLIESIANGGIAAGDGHDVRRR